MDKYTILGIHPGKGRQDAEATPIEGVPDNKVYARIRMKVGNDLIDENFDLPDLPGPIPTELHTQVYSALIKPQIEARVVELEFGSKTSKVHAKEHNADQAIHKGANK